MTVVITLVNIKMEKSSTNKVLNIKDFHKTFEKRKLKYPPGYFAVSKKTKLKRKTLVPFTLFKTIIKQYLKFYFFDFYNNKFPIYFPLGGWMKKVLFRPFINLQKRGKPRCSGRSFRWFNRLVLVPSPVKTCILYGRYTQANWKYQSNTAYGSFLACCK